MLCFAKGSLNSKLGKLFIFWVEFLRQLKLLGSLKNKFKADCDSVPNTSVMFSGSDNVCEVSQRSRSADDVATATPGSSSASNDVIKSAVRFEVSFKSLIFLYSCLCNAMLL